MRIIGGHDYYDSAIAYGIDPGVVFVRPKNSETDKLPIPERMTRHSSLWTLYRNKDKIGNYNHRYFDHEVSLSPLFVYLAGVLYTGARLSIKLGDFPERTFNFWDYEDLVKNLSARRIYFQVKNEYFFEGKSIKHHLEESGSKKDMDLCIANGITVGTMERPFGGRKPYWRINGDNLKEFEFYKVLDPYRCHQEISMYVGGVLPRPGAQMVEIQDQKIKAQKRGFDKWSFRKKGVNSI